MHIVAIRRRDGLLTLNCCCTKQPFGQYKRTFVADCCPCGLQGPAQGPQDECSCPRPRRILQRLQDAHSSTRIRFSLGQGQLAGFFSLPLLLGKWSPIGAWRTVCRGQMESKLSLESSLNGQMKSKWRPSWPPVRPSWPQVRPSWPQVRPSWPQVRPSWLQVHQDGPRCAQVGPKCVQVGSKC